MAEKLGCPIPNEVEVSEVSIKYFFQVFPCFNDIEDLDSVKCLSKINWVLDWIYNEATEVIHAGLFEDNGGEVFYSNFDIDTIPELLIPCWEYFKENATKLIDCYNPVYDLFAGYVLVGLIKNGNDSRLYSDCDDFLSIVVKEF